MDGTRKRLRIIGRKESRKYGISRKQKAERNMNEVEVNKRIIKEIPNE